MIIISDNPVTIYIDAECGVPGTEPGLNGTSICPVHNYEDAKLLADYFESFGLTTQFEETGNNVKNL